MSLLDIIKIIGALAAIIGTCYSIGNSKRSILRRIDRKESKIREIEHELVLKYGLYRGSSGPMDPLDLKKRELQNQIAKLKRYL